MGAWISTVKETIRYGVLSLVFFLVLSLVVGLIGEYFGSSESKSSSKDDGQRKQDYRDALQAVKSRFAPPRMTQLLQKKSDTQGTEKSNPDGSGKLDTLNAPSETNETSLNNKQVTTTTTTNTKPTSNFWFLVLTMIGIIVPFAALSACIDLPNQMPEDATCDDIIRVEKFVNNGICSALSSIPVLSKLVQLGARMLCSLVFVPTNSETTPADIWMQDSSRIAEDVASVSKGTLKDTTMHMEGLAVYFLGVSKYYISVISVSLAHHLGVVATWVFSLVSACLRSTADELLFIGLFCIVIYWYNRRISPGSQKPPRPTTTEHEDKAKTEEVLSLNHSVQKDLEHRRSHSGASQEDVYSEERFAEIDNTTYQASMLDRLKFRRLRESLMNRRHMEFICMMTSTLQQYESKITEEEFQAMSKRFEILEMRLQE